MNIIKLSMSKEEILIVIILGIIFCVAACWIAIKEERLLQELGRRNLFRDPGERVRKSSVP